MAKQGSTRDRPNPRHCPSIKLVSLTGRRSLGFHQGQRSVYRSEKAGYMTASSTAVSNRFSPCNTGASIHDNALQEHVRGACPELAYLQDICIESKHAEITRYSPRIDEARFHGGTFSRDFSSDDFDASRLEIVLPREAGKVAFNDVANRRRRILVDFFGSPRYR